MHYDNELILEFEDLGEKNHSITVTTSIDLWAHKEIECRGGKKEQQQQCYVAPDGLILVPLITGYGSFRGCVYSFGPDHEGREIDRNSLQKIVSERQYAAR